MDADRFAALRAAAQRGSTWDGRIRLNLFDDVEFTAVDVEVAPTSSGYAFSGRLAGVPLGTATLVINRNRVAGTVRAPAATYTIRSEGGGVLISEADEPPFDCGTVPTVTETGAESAMRWSRFEDSLQTEEDEQTVVDVLVVYTAEARKEAGGVDDIEALIDLAVAEANQAYRDSAVEQRVNLVHTEEVHPSEEADAGVLARQLQATMDGHMDGVHGLRDLVGADLVHLVAALPGCRGLALVPGSVGGFVADLGFSVSSVSCPTIVFVHELGHNMGLLHDRFDYRSYRPPKAYPWSHGYLNQAAFEDDAPLSSRWLTIMAYDYQCGSEGIFNCRRLLRFSDPEQRHLGDPLGVAGDVENHRVDGPANARRAMNDTRNLVAAYREPRPVLAVAADASKVDLDEEETFTLRADVNNRGRAGSASASLSFHRSTDRAVTGDDPVIGTAEIDGIPAGEGQSYTVEIGAPTVGGDYFYGACLNTDEAPRACSGVHVTVGPTAAVADARAIEAENLDFPVTLSAAREMDVTLEWSITPETAAIGTDVATAEGTVTIPAGETTATVSVATLGDTVAEPADTFRLALVGSSPSAPDGVVVHAAHGAARGTIEDDDGDLAIPDKSLRRALRVALRKDSDEPLLAEDLATLRALDWSHRRRSELGLAENHVTDLTGLEFATRLRLLDLGDNRLTDISAISHLPKLRHATFGGFRLRDISPLSQATGLRSLRLIGQLIEDVTPLSALTGLTRLELGTNRISDLEPLSRLSRLRVLHLDNNPIQDIAALSGMPALVELYLYSTQVSDLAPLSGLTNLAELWLRNNAISDLGPLAGLTGVHTLKLGANPIVDVVPLAKLRSLRHLELDRTLVSDLSPLAALENIRYFDVSWSRTTNIDVLRGIRTCQVFAAAGCRTAVAAATGGGRGIADISALADVPALTSVSLPNNQIADLSPLSGLTKLTRLDLRNNRITDLGPLADLTNLQEVYLSGNQITDLSPLKNLAMLTTVHLTGNRVSDISDLAALPRLSQLHVGHNAISDLAATASGTAFASLYDLYVHGNPLSEESEEVHLPALTARGVLVHRAWVSVDDLSAKEGDPFEGTVRISPSVSSPVRVHWGLHGSGGSRGAYEGSFDHLLDVEPTASIAEDIAWRDGYQATIAADASDTMIGGRVSEDTLAEPHEYLIVRLSPLAGRLPDGVTLDRWRPGWLNGEVSESVGLIVDAGGPFHDVPAFPRSGHESRQGFLRVVNLGPRNVAHVEAFDSQGADYAATLSLPRGEVVHFNSDDLELGNADKGLPRGVGSSGSTGDWRLRLWSNDTEVLAYMRTSDGFLTAMHDFSPRMTDGRYYVPTFNPGSNRDQVSILYLANPGSRPAEITVEGIDDHGVSGGSVGLRLDAGAVRTATADELESGDGLEGSLGDGRGKWRLTVSSDEPVLVASLLESPTGHLTNLSTVPTGARAGDDGTVYRVPMFPSAGDAKGRQGFVRVINREDDVATVRIRAFDASRRDFEAVTLSVGGSSAAHFNSDDLELGNEEKGSPAARARAKATGGWS